MHITKDSVTKSSSMCQPDLIKSIIADIGFLTIATPNSPHPIISYIVTPLGHPERLLELPLNHWRSKLPGTEYPSRY
jgi:hypothetical protein